jgi:cyclopropane-fatty-acyl-phospholipid synthase
MSHSPVNALQLDQVLVDQRGMHQSLHHPSLLDSGLMDQAMHLATSAQLTWTQIPTQDSTDSQKTQSGDTAQARIILNRLFEDYNGAFAVRLWNGSMIEIGEGTPAFTVCLEQAAVLRNMVWFNDPKHLAEAYFAGDIQVLGDFHAAMQLREHFEALSLPLHEKLALVFRALTLASETTLSDLQMPSKQTTHLTPFQSSLSPLSLALSDEDMPDDFYQCWLDEQRLHSCAYFSGHTRDLAQAQCFQLDLICQKLKLQHGDVLLDIGCGWGGLACWAAKHYGVFVHGITKHPQHYAYAVNQVQRQGLAHLVKIELVSEAYALPASGSFDKAVCISIADHIGEDSLPDYLAKVYALLKPCGLFLMHGISHEEHTMRDASTEFINRQLYPQGALTSFPQLLQQIETAKFDVFNVEGLRRHFVMTLHQWLAGLEANHQTVASLVGERVYRMWRLYLTASAIQFEQGVTGIHQIVATRR